MKTKKQILLQLFISTLYLSAFTFGGGYVIVTLMKKKFVDEYHWIENDEMLDLIAIAQSAPGAIAVNGAVVVGYKLAGTAGTIATIIPPFVAISVISAFYTAFRDNAMISLMLEGMQAGVGAVIAAVVYEMARGVVQGHSKSSNLIMIGAFIATFLLNVNVVYVVLVCILIGILRTWFEMEGRKK